MTTQTDVIDKINIVRNELNYYKHNQSKNNLIDVYDALEEVENTAEEYISSIIDIVYELEQVIDKLREVNY